MGFDSDQRLCDHIYQRTGTVATTAVLALNELLKIAGVKRLALVTPYTGDIQQRIVANYAREGIAVVAERHMQISVNHDFALVEPHTLRQLIREVSTHANNAQPQAISTYCTNLRAAPLADRMEVELGIPLLDTVSATFWGALRATGADPSQVQGWGSLFAMR
jgi:maleate isomerase